MLVEFYNYLHRVVLVQLGIYWVWRSRGQIFRSEIVLWASSIAFQVQLYQFLPLKKAHKNYITVWHFSYLVFLHWTKFHSSFWSAERMIDLLFILHGSVFPKRLGGRPVEPSGQWHKKIYKNVFPRYCELAFFFSMACWETRNNTILISVSIGMFCSGNCKANIVTGNVRLHGQLALFYCEIMLN